MVEYKLVRTRRRTVAIYIRDGAVEVRAPMRTPRHYIDRFVASKERWIAEKLAVSQERLTRRESFELGIGATVLLRGRERVVTAHGGADSGFSGDTFMVPNTFTREEIRSACIRAYRELAEIYIRERAAHLASKMNPGNYEIKIGNAQKRWGSCSNRRRINISWRLMMADDAVIDYIIVHELAHLFEFNHSARFWSLVGSVIPDYEECERRLKTLHERLSGEDWKTP